MSDRWYWISIYCVIGALLLFVCFTSGCTTPAYRADGPVVKVYVIRDGRLVRNQSGERLTVEEAQGFLCTSKQDLEKMLNSCTEPAVPAR